MQKQHHALWLLLGCGCFHSHSFSWDSVNQLIACDTHILRKIGGDSCTVAERQKENDWFERG